MNHILLLKKPAITSIQKQIKYSLQTCNLLKKHGSILCIDAAYSQSNVFLPQLSPQEVSEILRSNEHAVNLDRNTKAFFDEIVEEPANHAISSVDSNQLASNSPIEDKLAKCKCNLTTGFLFGVFDGHGGPECSQVVSKRLFDYIAVSLLPRPELRRYVTEFEKGGRIPLTEVFNDQTEFVPELQKIYDSSFLRWCHRILEIFPSDFRMEDALSNAFMQLDRDISQEAIQNQDSSIAPTLMRIALSGSVACVAHIDGPHLHVANTGDCGAVIGSTNETNHPSSWKCQTLTKDHNFDNASEVKRILSEHPESEKESVIKEERLLGMLMPFRAFGDVRFKWSVELQKKHIPASDYINLSFLDDCRTPPYLTAQPEVTYHRLRPQEKFLVLASDGLWESMHGSDIVTLVGEYMSGRQTLQPVQFHRGSISLGEISQVLRKRQEGLELKPCDTNSATHLIRHCIGGTDEGLDHRRLSHSLTLDPEVRRFFRDDISIHVVFLNSEFIRLCPIELR